MVIGRLAYKSQMHHESLDWALCQINTENVILSNKIILPDFSKSFPTRICENDPVNALVWVHTSSGSIRGYIKADYSLVVLPGTRFCKQMWIVVLERPAGRFHGLYLQSITDVPFKTWGIVAHG